MADKLDSYSLYIMLRVYFGQENKCRVPRHTRKDLICYGHFLNLTQPIKQPASARAIYGHVTALKFYSAENR